MARVASVTMVSRVSGSPSATAFLTQCRTCSSSRPTATVCSALVDRGDLGEDVDAVGVLVDHALEAAHLALDAAQPLDGSRPCRSCSRASLSALASLGRVGRCTGFIGPRTGAAAGCW